MGDDAKELLDVILRLSAPGVHADDPDWRGPAEALASVNHYAKRLAASLSPPPAEGPDDARATGEPSVTLSDELQERLAVMLVDETTNLHWHELYPRERNKFKMAARCIVLETLRALSASALRGESSQYVAVCRCTLTREGEILDREETCPIHGLPPETTITTSHKPGDPVLNVGALLPSPAEAEPKPTVSWIDYDILCWLASNHALQTVDPSSDGYTQILTHDLEQRLDDLAARIGDHLGDRPDDAQGWQRPAPPTGPKLVRSTSAGELETKP